MRNCVCIAGLFFRQPLWLLKLPTRAATGSVSTSSNLVAVTGYRHVCVREKWTRPLINS